MSHGDFSGMPDTARVWVFGATAPVAGAQRDTLLRTIDLHLQRWKAHGAPLVCAREWRDDHFLAVAVDEAATGASGCSIDGLFRALERLEPEVGTSLLDSASVFWRDAEGRVRVAGRPEFRAAASNGEISRTTPVFDTTVNTVGAWRQQFERPAGQSWHARLLPG